MWQMGGLTMCSKTTGVESITVSAYDSDMTQSD